MITTSANPWRTTQAVELDGNGGQLELRDRIISLMGAEDEWRVDEEDGFRWWAHKLETRVLITPGLTEDDDAVFRVECSVVLATVFDDEGGLVKAVASMAGVGGLRCLSDGETVAATTTSYVRQSDEDALHRFALVARTLIYFCERLAPALVSKTTAELKSSLHPTSGVRDEPSIRVRLGRYLTADDLEQSPFHSDLLNEAIESPNHPWIPYERRRDLYRGAYSLMTTDVDLAFESFRRPEEVAFVELQIIDAHLAYGSALAVVTSYPGLEDVDASELAADLNQAEATEWTGFPLFGSWWVNEDNDALLHTAIVPRIALDVDLLDEMLTAESYRCRWFAQRYELDQGLADLVELNGGSDRDAAEFILHWRNRPMS